MAVVEGVFFDTSSLLPGLIEIVGPRDAPQALLELVAAGRLRKPLTAWHCCLEFYAVATRLPEEFRLSPADAQTMIEQEILGRFSVVDLPRSARVTLLRAAARDNLLGGRLYDAHLAETARSAGAKIVVTENLRHFAGLAAQGIRVLTAAETLAELR